MANRTRSIANHATLTLAHAASAPVPVDTRRRRGVVATGATLLALSIGAPNACLDINGADKDPTKTGSGTSFADPQIVTRDNLALGGDLDVKDPTVTASVSSPYLSNGTWKNLTGHFKIKEIREHYWEYVDQLTPILPRKNFSGPGDAPYGTRAGTMVHGNIYQLSMSGKTKGGDSFGLDSVKYVKLSNDTLVVPVVVVSWRRHLPDPTFHNYYYEGLNLFDFNPIAVDSLATPKPFWRPDNSKMTPQHYPATPPLFTNKVDSPDAQFFTAMAPDKIEVPPDEIWQSCGIQFQVVAQVIAQLPDNWQNHCNVQAANLPSPEEATRKELAGSPLFRDYLVNDLKPIYVSYTNLSECQSTFGGFYGNTPGKQNVIEIDNSRPPTTTAHELGHALGLDHFYDQNGKPVEGNLMRVNPTSGEKAIAASQCTAAKLRAKLYSDRYDAFNRAIGRTYSESAPPPPSGGGDSGGGDDGGFDPGSGSDQICCKGTGDVSYGAPGSCPGKQVAMSECEAVCCSNGKKETRYLCEQQGGTGSACVPQ